MFTFLVFHKNDALQLSASCLERPNLRTFYSHLHPDTNCVPLFCFPWPFCDKQVICRSMVSHLAVKFTPCVLPFTPPVSETIALVQKIVMLPIIALQKSHISTQLHTTSRLLACLIPGKFASFFDTTDPWLLPDRRLIRNNTILLKLCVRACVC